MQRIWTLLASAAAAAIATTALAQDVPAVQGASEAEKARILGLIEGAKKVPPKKPAKVPPMGDGSPQLPCTPLPPRTFGLAIRRAF